MTSWKNIFFQVKYEKKIQRNSSYFFENKIIFILKYLGAKNCHFRWLHIFKVIGKCIADHDRDRQSWDFQNMIVSDSRSWFWKMIVSDRRSWKKWSTPTLGQEGQWILYLYVLSALYVLLESKVSVYLVTFMQKLCLGFLCTFRETN